MSIINNSKMADQRLNLLIDWLRILFKDEDFVISNASDDASFRRYFRIKYKNTTFIAMDAPVEFEDCTAFIKIDQHLIDGNIHAPKIIEHNLNQGFLLLEDLGNQTFLSVQQKKFNLTHYKNAINVLIKMQSLNSLDLPNYNQDLLTAEMQLLIDWYLPSLNSNQQTQLKIIFTRLSDNALNATQVFVHRDYHSRNLMLLTDNTLGVIDFQDAVRGANTYDLASLLKDAYFELPTQDLKTLLKYYYQQAKINLNFAEFERQFDLIGLQRHLKILGIFKRLYARDGKSQYLKNIPLVKKYALQMADKYPEFSLLKGLL